jgi:hypothetical protein
MSFGVKHIVKRSMNKRKNVKERGMKRMNGGEIEG